MVPVCVTDVNVTRDEVRQVDNYLVDQVEQLPPSQLASLYTSRAGREGLLAFAGVPCAWVWLTNEMLR